MQSYEESHFHVIEIVPQHTFDAEEVVGAMRDKNDQLVPSCDTGG